MAATFRPQPKSAAEHQHSQSPASAPGQPGGIFLPGTKVQVGNHRVVVERYLSEGGFAHVYVVNLPSQDGRSEQAVLKRVAVSDKEALANMRTEVETMKKLKGHTHIVSYMDSHASQLKGGGYEVFLLMEFCSGGGLIDFMNTRLKNRLTEPEILHIFTDAAEGVACMHYLKPPLLHRDLKIENILITRSKDGKKLYKLCDFGSAAPPRPAARSVNEGALIEDDIQKHTTFQYRSPEMIDVYRKRPIDEKSDIWALGVFLYKLCYYTTPFEEMGQMAILTASFKYPAHPRFSDRLKRLIAIMLMEEPRRRPNIYEVLKEACSMRGVPCPVKDIYSQRTESEARKNEQLPPRQVDMKSPPMAGAQVALPEKSKQEVPNVVPMRRGRLTSETGPTKTSASSTRKDDPFSALDSKDYRTRAAAVDQLSSKYPALDDFSLLQNKDTKYQFKANSPVTAPNANLQQRVTNALADQVFANTRDQSHSAAPAARSASAKQPAGTPDQPIVASMKSPPLASPQPTRPTMVSTGTMTGGGKPESVTTPEFFNRPVWKVPEQNERPSRGFLSRLNSRSKTRGHSRSSSTSSAKDVRSPKSPSSSRPSLEGGRPSLLELPTSSVHRSKSIDSAADHRQSQSRDDHGGRHFHPNSALPPGLDTQDATAIADDIDYLRAMEDESGGKQKSHHRRKSSTLDNLRNLKHQSMPQGRGILSGRLGDAFKRFEGSSNAQVFPERHSSRGKLQAPAQIHSSRTPSPRIDTQSDPITRSGSHPEMQLQQALLDESAISEAEDSSLSPEVKRELERRRLSAEERRVADAAAAWRSGHSGGAAPRASSVRASAIQSRVRSLLDESGRVSPVKRTAEGYGHFTDVQPSVTREDQPLMRASSASRGPSGLDASIPGVAVLRTRSAQLEPNDLAPPAKPPRPNPQAGRPNAPPKPKALRTGMTPTEGTASRPTFEQAGPPSALDNEWESDFSKRYPSLSVELVEAEIADSGPSARSIQAEKPSLKMRDV